MIRDSSGRPRSLVIEGWRGINHSIALVNQLQILELLTFDGLDLYHEDLPFAFPNWSRADNGSGLSVANQMLVDALRPPAGRAVDCVYRIGSPFRVGPADDRRRTVTFMVTELGLTEANFAHGLRDSAAFTRDGNAIVTPSRWSRDRLVDWGFDHDRIEIIPHGVDADTFAPLRADERREARRILGVDDDEILFLNVGLPSWNKGVDLLLLAFARLRAAGRKVRLILKDQRDLYGQPVGKLITTLAAGCSSLTTSDTLAAISLIGTNLGTAELRSLFGAADCYVSPYRAEGFNLPVIESIACGTPVIVTKGGATDDFCDDRVAVRIAGRAGRLSDPATGADLRFIEPSLPELTAAMETFATAPGASLPHFVGGRARLVERFRWREAARSLARVTVGLDVLADRGRAVSMARSPAV